MSFQGNIFFLVTMVLAALMLFLLALFFIKLKAQTRNEDQPQ